MVTKNMPFLIAEISANHNGNFHLDKRLIKCAKSQGNDSLKELYTWNYENTKIICYSWYDGEAGFENKHDLPPGGISPFLEEDSSVKLLYGDIFLCKLKDNKRLYHAFLMVLIAWFQAPSR